jgi:hypothetical protein
MILDKNVVLTIKKIGTFHTTAEAAALLIREMPTFEARVMVADYPKANTLIWREEETGRFNWSTSAAGDYGYFWHAFEQRVETLATR